MMSEPFRTKIPIHEATLIGFFERRDTLVIAAGFPCTYLSLAGKRAGVGPETRSGLYREVL